MSVDFASKSDSIQETVDAKIMLETVVKDSSLMSSLSYLPNELLALRGKEFLALRREWIPLEFTQKDLLPLFFN